MRRHWRSLLVAVVLVAGLLAATAYVAFGAVIYDRLTKVDAHCGGRYTTNTPASFALTGVDTAAYTMPHFEAVEFPARGDPNIHISAWWIPGATPSAPAVIVVHGLGDCKRSPYVLLPAGMLHKHGFAALVIDLRDEGDSTVDTGRYAGGVKEYRDALGAYDWLRSHEHASKIGIVGTSLGAATAMIATGQEQGIAAVWEDSGFADINVAIADELARNGYPTWLSLGGIIAGRLQGVDITALSPLEAVDRLDGRPIAIVHGTADTRLPVKHAYRLQQEVQARGGRPSVWIVPGVEHVQAMVKATAEYERRLAAFFDAALGSPAASFVAYPVAVAA